jgi:acyl transferase domain-containing protein
VLTRLTTKFPLKPTPLGSGPSRVSLNSFGYGGTNCHVILESLESYTAAHRLPLAAPLVLPDWHMVNGFRDKRSPIDGGISSDEDLETVGAQLFLLSANSEKALKASARDIKAWLSVHPRTTGDACHQKARLHDLAYTLGARRTLLPWRCSIVAADSHQLGSLLEGVRPVKASSAPRLAFVFTGQGAGWAGMGRELMQLQPFRDSVIKSEGILSSLGASARGWSLQEQMFGDGPSRLGEAEVAQPATTCLQIALVDLLRCLDVDASTVVGHSSGEIAAAYAAGSLDHHATVEL